MPPTDPQSPPMKNLAFQEPLSQSCREYDVNDVPLARPNDVAVHLSRACGVDEPRFKVDARIAALRRRSRVFPSSPRITVKPANLGG